LPQVTSQLAGDGIGAGDEWAGNAGVAFYIEVPPTASFGDAPGSVFFRS